MFERQLRRLKQQPPRHLDFLFLTAVRSVATSSCDADPVEAFLAAGGDPTRAITAQEVRSLFFVHSERLSFCLPPSSPTALLVSKLLDSATA